MQTKLQIIKRFLEPIKKSPLVHTRAFIIFSHMGINGVIHIFFLQKITHSLEIKNEKLFFQILILYMCYFIYFYTFEFLMRKYGWTEVMPQIMKDIQSGYIKKYVKLDNNHTEKYGVGKSISIIDKGISTWGELVAVGMERLAYFLVSLIFTLYMLFQMSYLYIIIFIGLFLLITFISTIFNNLALKYRKFRNEAKNLYTKQLVKILMSKNEIFQSDRVEHEIDILDSHVKDSIKYNKMMGFPLFGVFWIPSAIILLFLLLVFYYLGNQVLAGTMTLSTLVGVTGSIIIMQKSIDIFLEFYKNITKEFVVVQNLWDFFDNTPEITGYETGNEFEYKKGNFEIKYLNYGYNETKKVFENFNLNIEGGKILALVGNSGGGKTTLLKLLSGYIRQDSGEIIIDGQKLSEISLKSYYKNIGYLTQEPSVFDGSVRENLMYGVSSSLTQNPSPLAPLLGEERGSESPSTPRERDLGGGIEKQLHQIILDAQCEFIYELPNGLDTQIGERGVKLSGGQKQRLAIAKIMLKNPSIIFLDEPTSALDSFSEDKITKALHKLFENKTVIIVAHRLQTVKNADRIIVIENGKIVQDGNHETLSKIDGTYKNMLELQSGF